MKIIENTKIQKFSVFSIFRQKNRCPIITPICIKKETIFKDRSRQLVQNFGPVRLVWVGWSGSLVRFVGSVGLVRWSVGSVGLGLVLVGPRPNQDQRKIFNTGPEPNQTNEKIVGFQTLLVQKIGSCKIIHSELPGQYSYVPQNHRKIKDFSRLQL